MQIIVRIDGTDPFAASWSDFATDNADGIGAAELMATEIALRAGFPVTLGGGAAPEVTIERA